MTTCERLDALERGFAEIQKEIAALRTPAPAPKPVKLAAIVSEKKAEPEKV